jgi:hypothetical protein
MRNKQSKINLESKIDVRRVIQKGSVMNRLMTARRRIILGLVTSLMFSIIAGVSAPQVAQADPSAQSRSLPTGSSLYSFPCEDPANNTPRTFAEGQLSIVNTATGVKTPRGPGITDTDIRNQVGSIAACVTGSTYNYVTKTAFFVTSYAPYNLKSSLFEINLATGRSTFIGPLTPGNSVSGADSQGRIDTWGIATDSTGNMYALWKGISNGQFYVGLVNKGTGNLSLIREIQAPWNAYFVREGVSNFSYFDGKFYTASTFQVPLRDSFPHLYEIDVTTGNITSDVAATTSLNWFQGLAIDSNGVIWSSQINFVQTSPISSWSSATGFQKTSSSYQWWAVSSFIGPTVAPVTSGTAPNSQVATIPAGLTLATIPATTALPATSLNFGGNVPTAVTVVPVATNPATEAATPFTILGTTKIVDIQITGTFNGSATVCLDGAETDRLFHYTGGAWAELPSRSYSGGQVCGVTTSFSPFVAAPPTQAYLIATDAAAAAAAKAVSDAAAKAAAEAAAARREAEKQSARTDITSKLKNAKDLTVDSFAKAEIFGITSFNIAALQSELLALPEASRTDINQVLKVAYKYEVVGNIGSDRVNFMQPNSFVEIGLIPAQSKNKVSLVYAVRKLPEAARDTYAEIKAAVEAEATSIQSRKDRLATIISRNTTRYSTRNK